MKKKTNKKKELVKNIILIALILIVFTGISFLGLGYFKKATYEVQNPIATMVIKDYGTIKIELYPNQAENTVNNFITLANNGFYNGLTFHRIIKDFMIQGGDIKGDGTGTPTLSYIDTSIEKDSSEDTEYNIDGEFLENNYNNTLILEKGVIAMARGDYSSYASYYASLLEEGYNTAGSQFFIMTTDDNIALTGSYAGFGKVIEGLEVVEKIASIEVTTNESTSETSTPVNAPVIESITVETFDTNYKKPITHTPFDINNFFSSLYSY